MAPVSITYSARRVSIVRWAAQLGAITAEALAEREGASVASARAQLAAAERHGLLVRHRPLARQPALFCATRLGMRAAAVEGLDPGRVSAAGARHAIVTAAVAAALERRCPSHAVIGERELRREEGRCGRALASATLGAPDGSRLHRPDLVLWPAADGTVPTAVEVELTIKAPRRLQAICRAWARCRCVNGVIYLAPEPVRRALARAVECAQAGAGIAVLAFEPLGLAESLELDAENHPR